MPFNSDDDKQRPQNYADDSSDSDSSSDEPFAYRDVTERLPNEALREELADMTPEEQEAYLRHLEELAERYLGPGGP